MANFYTDNDDILFNFHYYNIAELADLVEGDYAAAGQYAWAPENAADAVENYHNILNVIGQVSGDNIAPRSESVDLDGNTLNEDGTVTRAPGMQANLDDLARAQVMGFTLPHRFGGLNCPSLVYNISNDIVSRADASLMNIYGLQGIAETINAFASEEIKQQYLPGFADGKYTGAMVLTEPDAGSDLQAIKTAASVHQDKDGNWYVHGVKRFITNGCGEVLLVLARSEPDRSGGLGLSLFVCEPGPTVKIRRLENKLGIHGSPTCEIFFNNTPCQLVGERQRGLVTYVMSLMNGARVGIAVQSIGIAEAAFRVARDYAASRRQFGTAIENLPAVRDLLVNMKIEIEAARVLTYETCFNVDHENDALRRLDADNFADKEAKKDCKQKEKKYKRRNGMLTPMSKYLASEMCNRVCYDAIQVLGGSGYMKDYPVERFARDARITTIYEGTSQLQVVAAVRGVCNGTAEKYLLEREAFLEQTLQEPFISDEDRQRVKEFLPLLQIGREQIVQAIAHIKEKPGTDYMDLHGRKLVDAAIYIIVGHLFLHQSIAAPSWQSSFTQASKTNNGAIDEAAVLSLYESIRQHKSIVARHYIQSNAGKVQLLCSEVLRDDTSAMTDFMQIVGPVPAV